MFLDYLIAKIELWSVSDIIILFFPSVSKQIIGQQSTFAFDDFRITIIQKGNKEIYPHTKNTIPV